MISFMWKLKVEIASSPLAPCRTSLCRKKQHETHRHIYITTLHSNKKRFLYSTTGRNLRISTKPIKFIYSHLYFLQVTIVSFLNRNDFFGFKIHTYTDMLYLLSQVIVEWGSQRLMWTCSTHN